MQKIRNTYATTVQNNDCTYKSKLSLKIKLYAHLIPLILLECFKTVLP